MKKILMALTMIGTIYGANAQCKVAMHRSNHRNNQNFKVCRTTAGYKICGKEGATAYADMSATDMTNDVWMPQAQSEPVATSMQMNNATSYEGYYRRHAIMVSYDDSRAPYLGEPSAQYDGPVKNEYRNINVNNTGADLAPSGGNLK